jgi:hypothetical protein
VKPIIAAVKGFCVAGGTEILQTTDIRVAAEDARFAIAEVKWSLFPMGGSTVRLPRQIPYCNAMEVLLTGEQFSAADALRWGLVNKLVPAGRVLDEARRYAEIVCANGPLAVQAVKRSVLAGLGRPTAEALEKEMEIGVPVSISEDAREGTKAFKEKRKARLQGALTCSSTSRRSRSSSRRASRARGLVWRDRVVTYAELARRTRRIGRALRRLGLGCRTERAALAPWESGRITSRSTATTARVGRVDVRRVEGARRVRERQLPLRRRRAALRARAERRARDRLPRSVRARSSRRSGEDCRGFALHPGAGRVRHRAAAGCGRLRGVARGRERRAARPAVLARRPLTSSTPAARRGLPKGVLWRHEDVFFNGLGGHIPGFERLDTEEKLLAHLEMGFGGRFLVLPPFMHGAGQWAAFNTFHRGGTVILADEVKRLDAHGAWKTIARERVDQMTLVGDAHALPLLARCARQPRCLVGARDRQHGGRALAERPARSS